jgi:hypothetical protein
MSPLFGLVAGLGLAGLGLASLGSTDRRSSNGYGYGAVNTGMGGRGPHTAAGPSYSHRGYPLDVAYGGDTVTCKCCGEQCGGTCPDAYGCSGSPLGGSFGALSSGERAKLVEARMRLDDVLTADLPGGGRWAYGAAETCSLCGKTRADHNYRHMFRPDRSTYGAVTSKDGGRGPGAGRGIDYSSRGAPFEIAFGGTGEEEDDDLFGGLDTTLREMNASAHGQSSTLFGAIDGQAEIELRLAWKEMIAASGRQGRKAIALLNAADRTGDLATIERAVAGADLVARQKGLPTWDQYLERHATVSLHADPLDDEDDDLLEGLDEDDLDGDDEEFGGFFTRPFMSREKKLEDIDKNIERVKAEFGDSPAGAKRLARLEAEKGRILGKPAAETKTASGTTADEDEDFGGLDDEEDEVTDADDIDADDLATLIDEIDLED